MNRRQSTELSPQKLKNLWNEWQLRALILLSLTSQIILVSLGNRRRYIAKPWIRSIVWFFYLLADSVATMAIGILSDDIGEVYWKGNWKSRSLDDELKAFWAPFLLLHLGGMDTITAYSLEDNELWLRHFFNVIAQAGMTTYILLMSWTMSSRLSPLFIVVFFVGLMKYCERVWSLFSASEKRFRDSIPDIPTSESRIREECKLKQLEGYHVSEHQVLEVEVPVVDESVPESDDAREILLAYSFFEMVKRLFADLILGFQDRDVSRAFFENKDMDSNTDFGYKALKVIEIELGLMYDVLYTKATIVYSYWGVTIRIFGCFLILIVLVMVSLDEALVGKNSSKIDVSITLVLLVVALLLDLCAFGELILSDQTAHWLIKHKKTTILETINRIRTMIPTNWGRNCKRWSKTVQQHSLLSFCFATRKKPLFCLRILKLFGIEEVAEMFWYKSITPPYSLSHYLNVDQGHDLPKYIFDKVKEDRSWAEKNGNGTDDLKFLYGGRGVRALERLNCKGLEWSVKIEFEQSVLVWHLATEICYQLEAEQDPDAWLRMWQNRGMCISRYMLYLLVEHPNMLPIGMGQIKFRDLYSDLANFIEMYTSKPLKDVTERDALVMLMEMVKDENMLVGGGDRSNFVIFHGCKLASQLRKYEDLEQQWTIIRDVWFEILCHAASQCKGRQHAQQLRRGGEYLTHLWLLMAHFGLTDHFQIPHEFGCDWASASRAAQAVVAAKAMMGTLFVKTREPWKDLQDDLDDSDTEVIKSSRGKST
ncbi:hypothetical protein RHGRI_029777 [Rhododendron griersonianum]|uniref:DUF4220 domain-containing protein n=1 Tax=Rhododendron griersonianum TaxID=479676 RepID=A0AAV6INT5_9ERIC|nr:hypothetical protein RHGRI_029777 [Rhododendron griersonianum]